MLYSPENLDGLKETDSFYGFLGRVEWLIGERNPGQPRDTNRADAKTAILYFQRLRMDGNPLAEITLDTSLEQKIVDAYIGALEGEGGQIDRAIWELAQRGTDAYALREALTRRYIQEKDTTNSEEINRERAIRSLSIYPFFSGDRRQPNAIKRRIETDAVGIFACREIMRSKGDITSDWEEGIEGSVNSVFANAYVFEGYVSQTKDTQ